MSTNGPDLARPRVGRDRVSDYIVDTVGPTPAVESWFECARASMSEGSFLAGCRVIELADELGEYCGKVLAGLGADVIKVEPPGGEPTRKYGPFYEDRPGPDRSLY